MDDATQRAVTQAVDYIIQAAGIRLEDATPEVRELADQLRRRWRYGDDAAGELVKIMRGPQSD